MFHQTKHLISHTRIYSNCKKNDSVIVINICHTLMTHGRYSSITNYIIIAHCVSGADSVPGVDSVPGIDSVPGSTLVLR